MKRGHKPKTSLTPEEKIKVAYLHDIRGLEQHVLADVFGVNAGRIAHAVKVVRQAVGVEPANDLEAQAAE